MVKHVILIVLLLQISCSTKKNEFNQYRYKISRFTIKPLENLELYKVIDTSSIYILTNIYNFGKQDINIPQALKFYKNGRIAKFKNSKYNSIELLNPKRAEMGFYKLYKNELEIEFMSNSAQSGNFLVKKKIMINKDTITSFYGDFKYEYIKYKLPDNYLIYSPDW
ncbi:hypothetical protein WFZ85_06835 [Flavobacterium sp. j3]|uniref:Lipoprotein n=1 Tax=Flavobacterium aureirubrum TaxID=3133147 RepID=A0ABU9N3M7_9FLAO